MNPTTVRIRPSRAVLALTLVAVSGGFAGLFPAAGQASAAARTSFTDGGGATSNRPQDDGDPAAVEVGVRFTSSSSGSVTGVRFYKTLGNTGTHVANLWSSTGALLASGVVRNETAFGWQSMTFAKPVNVTQGTTYVASYFAPNGHYATRQYAFGGGRTLGVAPVTQTGGVFTYGSRSSFPKSSWRDSTYYVAPVFSTSTSPTPPPTPPTPPTPPPTTPTTPAPPPPSSPSSTFPTPATTGWQHTGVTLQPYTGPDTITTAGTVIDGKDIRTCLQISANNVTIRNSRIQCASGSSRESGTMIVQQGDAYHPNISGLTITDVEISRPAGSNGGADYGLLLYGRDVTVTRAYFHNMTSGIHFSGGAVTVQDSYIGDLRNISGVDHIDGVIANGGSSNVTLRHNTIEIPDVQTTPIAAFPEGEPNSYWTVDNNLLNGGGYCVYASYTKGSEQPNHHMSFTNNVFGKKYYSGCGSAGPVDGGRNGARFLDGAANVWSNNVWQGTTTVVPSN